MGDPRLVYGAGGIVAPAPGWKWCPYCNGEGVIVTMDASPNLDEHEHECGFCDEGLTPDNGRRSDAAGGAT